MFQLQKLHELFSSFQKFSICKTRVILLPSLKNYRKKSCDDIKSKQSKMKNTKKSNEFDEDSKENHRKMFYLEVK